MKSGIQMQSARMILKGLLFLCGSLLAEPVVCGGMPEMKKDTAASASAGENRPAPGLYGAAFSPFSRRAVHRFGIEIRPGFIIPTNSFLRGENKAMKPLKTSLSGHLKYSFQSYPDSYISRIYRDAYQGVGLAYYTFGNRTELGDPVAFYLFQGARIADLAPRLSLHYEWNFGVSFGWKPYDYIENPFNKSIGSKANAYIDMNFYLRWMLSRQFDLTAGLDLTHFSNGNTCIPNAGLNTVGLKVGVVYKFEGADPPHSRLLYRPAPPEFPRHISYDLVAFGSWRRKGVEFNDKEVAAPDAYPVVGVSFAPMYNLSYKFRAGVSFDAVYDGSANVYTEDYIAGTEQPFYKPALRKQFALGLSARAEYVMPFFTVGVGLGANVLQAGGDLKSFYQILALKVHVTRNSFLHIGYNLQNFHTPNYLMLGFGIRFHNRYPALRR